MELHRYGLGCTAWRITEPDAPGLFALVYDARTMTIADKPEIDPLTFALFNEKFDDPIGTIELDGRAGLNRWYHINVGQIPDKEPDGPLSVMQLIDNVAAHLLLRCFEGASVPR